MTLSVYSTADCSGTPLETVETDQSSFPGFYLRERIVCADGACVDSEGFYWSASVYGWSVIRISPSGHVVQRIEVPVEDHKKLFDPELWPGIVTKIKNAGFEKVEVETDGFRSGRLNDSLDLPADS